MKILSLSMAMLLFVNPSIVLAEENAASEQTSHMPDADESSDRANTPVQAGRDELTEIAVRRYMLGGALGTIFGFGIGHAVQGRYRADLGWLYTAGEIGSLLVMGSGFAYAHNCQGEGDSYDRCVKRGEIMAFSGYLLYTGARIAEIVNVWLPREDRYIIVAGQAQRDKLSVLPVFNTQSLGLALVTPL